VIVPWRWARPFVETWDSGPWGSAWLGAIWRAVCNEAVRREWIAELCSKIYPASAVRFVINY